MRSRLSSRVAGLLFAAVAGNAALAVPAHAEIVARDDNGFVIRQTVDVGASTPEAWRTLVKPATWWSSEHTFSGEAANLTLDPVPGGCFCEKLPASKQGGAGALAGGVQHMRVVYVEPGRALRMTGALGPLQSEAVLGSMTITLKAGDRGTRILIEYVVGGYMRYRMDQIAPAVDRMLGQQIAGLADKLGGALAGDGAVPIITPKAPADRSDNGDSAPVSRNAPQGPSLDPDGAPLSGRPLGTLRGLPSLPPGPARSRTTAPAVADDDGLVVSDDTPAPAAARAPSAKPAVARAALGKAAAAKSAKKPAPARATPAKPAPAKPKPAAQPTAAAPRDEATAQKDAQAAFDAAMGPGSDH